MSDEVMRAEVLAGLRAAARSIPSKYFYDARGSALFEEITALPEYYPTVTELGILERALPALSEAVGEGAAIIEYGSGSGIKTRRLLGALERPASYTPIEISPSALEQSVEALRAELPGLDVMPVCADYTATLALPAGVTGRRVVFFPGSTLGNFTREEAAAFLARVRALVGEGGGLILGLDLKKDPATLHAAYNDAQGVTAAFNKNLLMRINLELSGDFDVQNFYHYAPYNPRAGRIEMYLISACEQVVTVAGEPFKFNEGEALLTEYSHKYTIQELDVMARSAGLRRVETWVDDGALFSLSWLVAS